MHSFLRRYVVSVIVVITFSVLAHGQEITPTSNPSGKILEIHSTRSPRPSVIVLDREQFAGFWASGFARTKEWKMPSTGDPVQAISFRARLVGDRAELLISLFSGKRFGDVKENIASVSIAEGETIVVSDLRKAGFEPVTVKMLATSPAIADVPLVMNPAPLLRTTVSNIVATIPTFNVKFENNSPKEIVAFEWHTETGGRKLLSGVARGSYGNALMEPGGSFEMYLKANKRESDPNPVTMVIGAVIYRDGSIDGSPQAAAAFLGMTEGRKKALDQLVPLLQKAAETKSGRPDIADLIAKVDLLTDAGPKVNGRPAGPVGIAFAGMITEALGRLRQLNSELTGKSDTEVVSSMTELANFYRVWQGKMKN